MTISRASSNQRLSLWARPHLLFLTIAYGYSWLLWLGAWVYAERAEAGDLLFNQEAVWRFVFERDVPRDLAVASLIALLAVFGPMLAGIVMSRRDTAIRAGDLEQQVFKVNVGWSEYGRVLGVLAIVTIPPFVISALFVDRSLEGPSVGQLAPFLLVFFVYQMLTSGTEEIGWRGYLTLKLLPGRNFWDTGWAVGIVWALWHLPSLVMIFAYQGMAPPQLVGSAIGFGIGTVAMSILHTWFYERTASVFLNIFIHAAFNTIPLTIVLLYEGSPAAVLSNLLLWGVVAYIRRGSRDRNLRGEPKDA